MNKKTSKTRKGRGRRLFSPGGASPRPMTRNPASSPLQPKTANVAGKSASRSAIITQNPKTEKMLRTMNAEPSLERAGERKRTRAAQAHSERVSGANVGGRVGGRGGKGKGIRWFVLPLGHAKRMASDTSHHYLPTKTLIEDKSGAPAATPINLAPFVVRHHGNSKKLRMYEKMYPSTNFLLKTVAQTVGGDVEGQAGQKFPLTSVCGFNRTGIFNPFGYHDAVARASNSAGPLYNNQLSFGMSHYNKGDFTEIIDTMIKKTGLDTLGNITNYTTLLEALEPLSDGTTKFSLPITEMRTEYELMAKSQFMCTHVIIYLVTPKRPLNKQQDPLACFFSPFNRKINSNSNNAQKEIANAVLPDKMVYKPQVQSNPQVAITGTQGSYDTKLWDNAAYVSTLATEIVPEAALQDSRRFNENWEVVHQYRVCLQPQQALRFSIESEINTMTDLFEALGYDPDHLFGNNNAVNPDLYMWPGKTVFPIIRFWGEDSTGTSIGLRRVARPAGDEQAPDPQTPAPMMKFMSARNKLMDQTQMGTCTAQLNLTMKKYAKGHFPNLPVSNDIASALSGAKNGTTPSSFSYAFLDCLQQRNKNFFPYNDKERGQSACYHRVNTNIYDFVDADAGGPDYDPYTGKQIPTVMELDTEAAGITTNTNWPVLNLELGSTNDVNNVEIQTVTNQVAQETGSTV